MMTRRPLGNCQLSTNISPNKTPRVVSAKRARSPEHQELTAPRAKLKRARAIPPQETLLQENEKERRHAEREQQKAEFREKYCRAFPKWSFYFDTENIDLEPGHVTNFELRIRQLGGKIEDFFSRQVSHLITNQPIPVPTTTSEKENQASGKSLAGKVSHALKSPIKLKGRADEKISGFNLIDKAVSFNIKIWSPAKLESVLERCTENSGNASSPPGVLHSISATTISNPQRSLSRLLKSERIHGTSERDPTQKRYDFRYFSRSSHFVLVEDLRQELATIAVHEYVLFKGKSEAVKPPWPVLHCHPQSRGPFVAFDEKERKRWNKLQEVEKKQEKERTKQLAIATRRKVEAQLHAMKAGDLRRSVSMNNLQRRAFEVEICEDEERLMAFEDGENIDSVNASGYLASGAGLYMAASGNSVGITSTTGTTSTANYSARYTQLPSALSGRIKQQILTSRKFPSKTSVIHKANTMGPPASVPERHPLLRKSRSTNTLKLPKREEGSKPGYCESCRMKFDDFKAHVTGRKHGKFAADESNYLQLDCIIARVCRRTVEQVHEDERNLEEKRRLICQSRGPAGDGDFHTQHSE